MEGRERVRFEKDLFVVLERLSIGIRLYQVDPTQSEKLRLLYAKGREGGEEEEAVETRKIEGWLLKILESGSSPRELAVEVQLDPGNDRHLKVQAFALESQRWAVAYEERSLPKANYRPVTITSNIGHPLLRAPKSGRKLSHDFNNLLTVILSQCDVLLRSQNSEKTWREGVEVISTAARRTAAIARGFFGQG